MRIAMTIKVRDEAEIIADNLRYHAAQGVDFFVVADHGSTDATRSILAPLVSAGLVHLVELSDADVLELTQQQMTDLAATAAGLGADWIIHNDADEFWWPVVGNLRDAFALVPDEFGLLMAPRAEFIPRPGDEPWHERLIYRDARALHRPKIAHRPHPRLHLHGVHPSSLWVEGPASDSGENGSPKFRTTPPRPRAPTELCLAPVFPVRCLHFALRSFEQYEHRLEIALRTADVWGERGERIAAARSEGRLREIYEGLMLDDEALEGALADGWLVEDKDLGEYLRESPDPLTGDEAPAGARAWAKDRQEGELRALQADAMSSISRRLQHGARAAERRKRRRRRAQS